MKKLFFISTIVSTSMLYPMQEHSLQNSPRSTGGSSPRQNIVMSNQQLSPRLQQPSPRQKQMIDTSSFVEERSRKISDPIARARSQSQESLKFVREENAQKFFDEKNKDKK